MIDPSDSTRRKTFSENDAYEDLLVPVFRAGHLVYGCPALAQVRDHATRSVSELDPSITRFLNPHSYPVGLERSVHDVRDALVRQARGINDEKE